MNPVRAGYFLDVETTLELDVPADVRCLRAVRLMAVDAGARAGLDCDEVDDLRLAVDELCFAVVRTVHAEVESGERVVVRFRIGERRVSVHGVARLGTDRVELGLSRFAASILATVCDHFEYFDADSEVVRFALVKTAQPIMCVGTQ